LILQNDEIEATYRQEAMGSLADIANSIAMGLMAKLDEFAQWSLVSLKDKHGPTRSNAAFLFGILCHYCGEATVKYFPVALEGLTAMFNETDNVVRDNACGAIGRMIIGAPAAVPLAQVSPARSKPDRICFFCCKFERWVTDVIYRS
jgi:hypothetical protein